MKHADKVIPAICLILTLGVLLASATSFAPPQGAIAKSARDVAQAR